mgnify:CR=1 FL=1
MSIEWGKGSAFNLGRINASDNKLTYLHVDNRRFKTKEELDECIMEWMDERKKM